MTALRQRTPVVLVACGSFNPITNMHLRLFEVARDALHAVGGYRVIAGVISPVSDAYTKKGLASAKHRCEMVRKAIQSSNWISLDTWESEQPQWLETVYVLQHVQQTFKPSKCVNEVCDTSLQSIKRRKAQVNDNVSTVKHANNTNSYVPDADEVNSNVPEFQIKFLCGADVLQSFNEPGVWKPQHMEEILDKFGLVVCQRNDSVNLERLIYESDLMSKFKANICIVTEWIPNEISSTKVRRALRRGESVKYLLPDSVIDYIQKNNIYQAVDDK